MSAQKKQHPVTAARELSVILYSLIRPRMAAHGGLTNYARSIKISPSGLREACSGLRGIRKAYWNRLAASVHELHGMAQFVKLLPQGEPFAVPTEAALKRYQALQLQELDFTYEQAPPQPGTRQGRTVLPRYSDVQRSNMQRLDAAQPRALSRSSQTRKQLKAEADQEESEEAPEAPAEEPEEDLDSAAEETEEVETETASPQRGRSQRKAVKVAKQKPIQRPLQKPTQKPTPKPAQPQRLPPRPASKEAAAARLMGASAQQLRKVPMYAWIAFQILVEDKALRERVLALLDYLAEQKLTLPTLLQAYWADECYQRTRRRR